MSKDILVNLPDDLAERVERESDPSAFIATALRGRLSTHAGGAAGSSAAAPGWTFEEDYAARGITITAEGRARARAKLDAVRAAWPPERFAEYRRALGISDDSANAVRESVGMPPL